MKKTAVIVLLLLVFSIITFTSCNNKANGEQLRESISNTTGTVTKESMETETDKGYMEVVELCCRAINEKNLSLLDDVLYKDLGDEWNEENILEIVDDRITDEYYSQYLPVSPDVDDVEVMDPIEIKEWFYEETGVMIDIEEYCVVESSNDVFSDIGLCKAEGKWYILCMQ